MLSDRQGQVLQAVVASYAGHGTPVSSDTVAAVLPTRLSPQSVRNTLASLAEMGVVEKPHRSAGCVPTDLGLRVFLDQWFSPRELGPYEKRDLEETFDHDRTDGFGRVTTKLLSERTHQLGFFRAPRLERLTMRHVSFVRVSSERVLAVLVTEGGRAYQRVLEEPGQGDQPELDRMASTLSERVAGQTLAHVRKRLVREAAALRSHAEILLERVLRLGPTAEGHSDDADLVLSTRLVLLDQPEFRDPERLRALLRTVEEKERLVELLDHVSAGTGVHVAFGEEVGDSSLRHCAVVAASYGSADAPLGALGVIGPSRMDYARVIPLVGFMSRLMTEMHEA